MKKLCFLVVILFVCVLVISAAMAEDYERLDTRGGVEAMVKYDPLGPNNLIVAFVKFVNNNGYKVTVDWKPLITCEGSDMKKGYGESFVISEGASYQVTMWRAATCQDRKIKDLRVEMGVTKITGN